MIVAIDGPAGSGKTTVAKQLASKINFFYLDTGATYRALTYLALEKEVNLKNEKELAFLARNLKLKLDKDKVFLNGQDITKEIRTPRIDKNISKVVGFAQVRKPMILLQRSIAQGKNSVVEGRDITTVVFPQAQFKFYLDADQKTRAKRRIQQLNKSGQKINSQEVIEDLIKRDQADFSRKVGSLKLSKEAVYLDTTGFSINQVIEKLASFVKLKN